MVTNIFGTQMGLEAKMIDALLIVICDRDGQGRNELFVRHKCASLGLGVACYRKGCA